VSAAKRTGIITKKRDGHECSSSRLSFLNALDRKSRYILLTIEYCPSSNFCGGSDGPIWMGGRGEEKSSDVYDHLAFSVLASHPIMCSGLSKCPGRAVVHNARRLPMGTDKDRLQWGASLLFERNAIQGATYHLLPFTVVEVVRFNFREVQHQVKTFEQKLRR